MAVIAAVNLTVRNRSAHIRYLLWLIVPAKCLVPPFYTVPLAILPQPKQAESTATARTAYLPPPERKTTGARITEPADSSSISSETSSPAVERRWRSVTIHEWLGIGWMVGAGAFLTFNLLRALRANLWLSRRRKALSAQLHSDIESLFSTHDIRSFPDIWLVKGFNQPFVWGLVRGSIYLPTDFLNINRPEHQRSVLGHEVSHVLRFDAAVNILQVIAQAIFWFHPLIWWANRKIRQEREKCCDEMAVVRLNTSPRDYSTAILETLANKCRQTRPVPSLAVAGPVKNIEERIKAMLRPGRRFRKRPSAVAVTVTTLLALLIVPAAPVLTARAGTTPSTGKWVQTNGLYGGSTWSFAVSGKNLFAGTDGNGVFRSTDNGTSWTRVNNDLKNRGVVAFAVSDTNLFAGSGSGGVFRSTDNGTSWTEVNNGLTNTAVRALAVIGTNLFAGTWRSGVFLSTNNGES